jgi:hypothetical protein
VAIAQDISHLMVAVPYNPVLLQMIEDWVCQLSAENPFEKLILRAWSARKINFSNGFSDTNKQQAGYVPAIDEAE